MNMFDTNFQLLTKEANRMGYKVTLVSSRYVSSLGHLTKHINISKQSGEVNSIYEFAHELGHCIQFKLRWDRLNGDKEAVKQFYRNRDKSKMRFMFDELEAWVRGFSILYKNNINTKGFCSHTFHCLSSHFKKTKPNSVKN